jgi:hypothetical protein
MKLNESADDGLRKELEQLQFSDLIRNSERFAETNKFPTTYVTPIRCRLVLTC